MSLPDSEAMLAEYVEASGVRASSGVPKPRPDEFVQVQRTGGAAVNRVLDVPQITFTVWANTKPRASELARKLRDGLLGDTTSLVLVRRSSEVGGLYFDPDPDTGTPRYTFTIEFRVRAAR